MTEPSPWVRRWAPRIPPGKVLDLASGPGRHARLLLESGFDVVAVDRDPQDIPGSRFKQADLEDGSPWPFPEERFQGIVVTNYLPRPLFSHLLASLAPGGVLIYETFMLGNERYGRPSNPEFLLGPGELLQVLRGQVILGFEEGFRGASSHGPKPSMIQRVCAAKGANG